MSIPIAAAHCLLLSLHPPCTLGPPWQEEERPGRSPQAGSLPMSIPGGGREGRTYRVCNNENGSGSVTVRLGLCQWGLLTGVLWAQGRSTHVVLLVRLRG